MVRRTVTIPDLMETEIRKVQAKLLTSQQKNILFNELPIRNRQPHD